MPQLPPATKITLAAQFHARYQDYFFEDAHFQVEAAATTEAREAAPNVFEFPDGSVLHIASNAHKVYVYDSLQAREAYIKAVS